MVIHCSIELNPACVVQSLIEHNMDSITYLTYAVIKYT